ncbi:MAG: NAD(+) diphosphatase [Thermomonas sp.]
MNDRASPFAFVDGALDRADHLRADTNALTGLWPHARVIVLDKEGRAYANEEGELQAPIGAELGGGPGITTFLGLHDDQAWFAADAETLALQSPQRIDLRTAAARWPAWQATVFAQARALQHWHQRHRYCSTCGDAMRFVRAGWLGVCEACGSEHYPRTDQAVIVAVGDGERLLLGRQASWAPRRWSVVAGFVEPGETLEMAVAREVREETGVRVRAARYLASQPWPFPGSLMLGFMADADPDEPVVGDELEAARWFTADEVRACLTRDWAHAGEDDAGGIVLSPSISIARHVICTWLQHHDATRAADRGIAT